MRKEDCNGLLISGQFVKQTTLERLAAIGIRPAGNRIEGNTNSPEERGRIGAAIASEGFGVDSSYSATSRQWTIYSTPSNPGAETVSERKPMIPGVTISRLTEENNWLREENARLRLERDARLRQATELAGEFAEPTPLHEQMLRGCVRPKAEGGME